MPASLEFATVQLLSSAGEILSFSNCHDIYTVYNRTRTVEHTSYDRGTFHHNEQHESHVLWSPYQLNEDVVLVTIHLCSVYYAGITCASTNYLVQYYEVDYFFMG